MTCRNINRDGNCSISGIMIDYDPDGDPHDITMACEFNGDVQRCLSNLIELNGQNILWKAYALIRVKQTNPDVLEIAQDIEKEEAKKRK